MYSIFPVSHMRILVKGRSASFSVLFLLPPNPLFLLIILCDQGQSWITNANFGVSELVSLSALSRLASVDKSSWTSCPSASPAPITHPRLCTCSWTCLCVGCSLLGFPDWLSSSITSFGKLLLPVLSWPRWWSALMWYLVETTSWFWCLWVVPCEARCQATSPGQAPSRVWLWFTPMVP